MPCYRSENRAMPI